MTENLLLEQYGKFKRQALDESPYRCLLNTVIEMNPHQINAFCAAIQALKTGGIVLADEVGLGKTIEAGLVLKHVLDAFRQKQFTIGTYFSKPDWHSQYYWWDVYPNRGRNWMRNLA